jgi:hypothetical protein
MSDRLALAQAITDAGIPREKAENIAAAVVRLVQGGVTTIICGSSSIVQADQPNEFVAQSELDACDAFIGRVADSGSSPCAVPQTPPTGALGVAREATPTITCAGGPAERDPSAVV